MDASVVGRHSDLLAAVDIEPRLKLNSSNVVVTDDGAELLGAQYINLQRLSEVPKVEVGGSDATLPPELLGQHAVVELTPGNTTCDFTQPTVVSQFYDDDLLPHDLTEEDRRLAAALVAVQLVQQQKHHQLQSPLSPLTSTIIPDKPQLVTQPPTYIQAFDDDPTHHHLLEQQQNHDRLLKLYHTPTTQLQELRLPPLPPLKKVLSNQTLMRSRYDRTSIDHLPGTLAVDVTSTVANLELKPTTVKLVKAETLMDAGGNDDDIVESDYEAESDSKPSRRSLPHKKRIPRMPFTAKNEEQGLTCEQCGRLFRRQKAFDTHIAIAHPQIDEFSEPEDMMEGIRHVVNIQTGTADDECDEKLRSWRYSDDLNIPSDICLDEIKPDMTSSVFCDDLNEPEPDKGKKRRTKTTQCPHCSRVFTHRNSLLYHIRSHTGRRPHKCEVCGKSFFAANALRVHMRMHSGDKPYKCEVCSRSFRQWGDLKYHMTSLHSSQKQYQCEFCGKDFARKYSLIVHRRIHTGEKNYICEYCRKTFRASSYLVNHRRIHTGEKPYSCDICHKAFRVKSDMKRHRNTHNKERTIVQDRLGPDIIMVPDQEPESILPDTQVPLNLNMRQDSGNGLPYNRDPLEVDPLEVDPLEVDPLDRVPLERDSNTLYVWLPSAGTILPDE